MENRRKSPRVKANLVVSFKVQTSRLVGGTRIKDISETGVCIPSKHYLPVGSLVEMEIRADDFKEPIKTMGRVVRIVNRNDNKFQFEVGLEFVNMSFANRNLLNSCIRHSIAHGGAQDAHWTG